MNDMFDIMGGGSMILKQYTQGKLPDIGHDAIWSVSSCKREFPISNLRDNNVDTYWQSDGNQPHTITCQFRLVALRK